MSGLPQMLEHLLDEAFSLSSRAILEQLSNQLPMRRFKGSQMQFGAFRIAVPRGINGTENQIGDSCHRRDHHDHAFFLDGLAQNGCALAETRGVTDGGTAEFHYDQSRTAHFLLSNSLGICSIRTGSRETDAPSLSAGTIRAVVFWPSSAKISVNFSA